jgi:hypothetical protein
MKLEESLPPGRSRLYVRPSRLRMNGAAINCPNVIDARVRFVEFLGDMYRYHVSVGELEFFCDHPGAVNVEPGEATTIGWETKDMRLFS